MQILIFSREYTKQLNLLFAEKLRVFFLEKLTFSGFVEFLWKKCLSFAKNQLEFWNFGA